MPSLVFNIQRFSVHDGPGIRTTVFLKGCPLRCSWCHNPESQRFEQELLFSPQLCIDCKSCEEVCPETRAREILATPERAPCQTCAAPCADACPGGAIERVARERTVDEVLAEVERDRVFYEQSGGGLTLSGGEPMAHFPFTLDLLKRAKEAGLHTCVETCGYGKPEHFDAVAPLVDLFLWDVKDTNPERHKRTTGARPEPLLDNLRRIDAAGADTVLRCVIVKNLNCDATHFEKLADIYASLDNVQGLELLPHHPLGGSKYERLGCAAPSREELEPDAEQLTEARRYLTGRGVHCLGE